MSDLYGNSPIVPPGTPQLVASKRDSKNRRRGHSVPSTLTPQMRAEIAAAVSFGRSIPQVAKEYNADKCVVTEIWLRAELSKLRTQAGLAGLRRAA